MKDPCVFCRIINDELSAMIVFEDDISLAFLDHRPLFPGHTLLARAVELAMEAEGTFVAMNNRVSQSVPHLHVHVVPRRRKDGLKGFFWPRNKYQDDEHIKKTQAAIKKAILGLT